MKNLYIFFLFCCSIIWSNESPNFSGTIVFVGDSHVCAFRGLSGITQYFAVTPQPFINWTMYAVGRDNGSILTQEDRPDLPGCGKHFSAGMKLKYGDAVVYSFGMIDVNWLIWKQIHEKDRDLEELAETLADKYLDVISNETDKNVIKIVYNITPPSGREHYPPYIGTVEERIIYTRKINEVLARECALRGLEFLDIYDQYCDEKGMLRFDISDGNHHIHEDSNSILLEKLWEILRKYCG